MTGSDYILSALEAEGVSELFGLVGEGNADLVDALNDSAIEFTYARHEQVAVTMADGYARTTGDVGVVTLTHGPGVTNGATGIAIADRDNIPIVVIVGDTGFAGRETSLQYLDHVEFTRPISAYQTRVEHLDTLPEKLRAVFKEARTRRGPAILEVPGDIQEGETPSASYEPVDRTPQRIRPDPRQVDEACALIDEAESPVILAGGGATSSEAGQALVELAETVGAPIATTFYAKGLLPDSHPMVSGIAGTFMTPANDALLWDADLLLAVGAQLSGKTTRYGELFSDASVVQLDIDPAAIGTHREPDVGIVGDARATIEAITDRIEPHSDRVERVRAAIREVDEPETMPFESDPDRIDPRELTVELANRVPDDTIVTVDSGNNTGFPPVFHRIDGDGRMFINGNFGSMGFALPAALGSQSAAPDRRVLCYIGDGAFLQVVQDVETAVRYGLPIIVTIYNDESYGIIRHRQHLDYGRETAASYPSPDYETVARGLGARAATIRSVDDLDVVDEFLEEEPATPLVLDARTIPDVARPGFPPY